MSRSLRVIFFGTPEIAVPTLEAILAGPHEVVGVVSQPDRGRGRGRKTSPSPVSEVALREDLPLWRPEKVGAPEIVEALASLRADIGVVVAFGQFLPKKVRELPSEGFLINAHASLLPKLRGAAPIARAILDGEAETGISVMRIEREMDAGPVALTRSTPIGDEENTAELSARLSTLAADAIGQALDQIATETIEWTDQDAGQATFAAKIEKADTWLDLREPASALARRIHALGPKPGGSVTLAPVGTAPADEAGVVLKIARAGTADYQAGETPAPGTIEVDAAAGTIRFATGSGWLVPRVLQKPGGKALAVADFLRGFEIGPEARLLVEEATHAVSSDAKESDR